MTARIVDIETANRDLNKSLTELKVKYQVNIDKLKLENTAQGSKIIELDLKLDDAIVGRDEVERLNGVLSEERNVHRAEIDKLTNLLAEKESASKNLKMNPISRIRPRNVIDSDDDMQPPDTRSNSEQKKIISDDDMVQDEPPDGSTVDDEDLNSGFHLGR